MKLNNKGFTLIEILAVVVILGILIALMYPSVSKLINKNREENYQKLEDSIVIATKAYISDYRHEISLNGTLLEKVGTTNITEGKILINYLVKDGKLKIGKNNIIINPKEQEKCLSLNDSYIIVNYDNTKKTFIYNNKPVLKWENKETTAGDMNLNCVKK